MDLFQKLTEPVSPSLIKTFGVFGVINFPLLYILGASYLNEVPAALYLRSIGFLLCFFLALVDYWPNILNRYKNHIWLTIITYCLPFFATYMFIANGGSSAWQVKVAVAMFWAVLITNWVQSLVIMSIGFILALIVYPICSGPLPLNIDNLGGHIFNYAWVVVIASIFARRKESCN